MGSAKPIDELPAQAVDLLVDLGHGSVGVVVWRHAAVGRLAAAVGRLAAASVGRHASVGGLRRWRLRRLRLRRFEFGAGVFGCGAGAFGA